MKESILILDFGSQYTQLIARRIREQHVFCDILPYNTPVREIIRRKPAGVILSGGPASVNDYEVPLPAPALFELGIPTLGICYGMQAMVKLLGGDVVSSGNREYGKAILTTDVCDGLFAGTKQRMRSWMSHGDSVRTLPKGFRILAHTSNTPAAAIAHAQRKLYGLQFHPEVVHTERGEHILHNFIFQICKCQGDWTMESYITSQKRAIKRQVGKGHVILGLSGGVDSSVAALLIHQAVGAQLTCIFVDNGLLRLNEVEQVEEMFAEHFHLDLRVVDARDEFLRKLRRVSDPEQKRKIIGETFIRVFEREARTIKGARFLAQGTLYPDVIESQSAFGGPSVTIKSHHNVGGLPANMQLKLVEPLRELFKDEVREMGRQLGLPPVVINRHPFPGPGLAVRILGDITRERLRVLQEADAIAIDELRRSKHYDKVWQALTVLLPVKSVGVMGDERTYDNAVVFRAVTSRDGMTADWAKLPSSVLGRISNRIINEVKGVNRVAYDISSKPPATIEWE
jgi:GMP synthase (glutamine-hydrolysing)